jgi:hypothetical protein
MGLRRDVSIHIYNFGYLWRLKDEYVSKWSLRLEESKRDYHSILYKKLRC